MGGEKLRKKKKTVQMPSPGLLNLRGSKGKRDVSDFQKAPVFRPGLQQLQLSSGSPSLSAARQLIGVHVKDSSLRAEF